MFSGCGYHADQPGEMRASIVNLDVFTRFPVIEATVSSTTPGINLPEVSGIVSSIKNKKCFWVHQDHGNNPYLYLYSKNGQQISNYKIIHGRVRDAEDIAIGPDSSGVFNQLFLADIGDNYNKRESVTVFAFDEPAFTPSKGFEEIRATGIIRLQYPDLSQDADAFFVDPISKKMVVLTKSNSRCRIYTLGFPYSYQAINTLEFLGKIDFNGEPVTAADITMDGKHVLVKTYQHIYRWKRNGRESLVTMFSRQPVMLPYVQEPKGEALCWGNSSKEYFTYSEKQKEISPKLYAYKLK